MIKRMRRTTVNQVCLRVVVATASLLLTVFASGDVRAQQLLLGGDFGNGNLNDLTGAMINPLDGTPLVPPQSTGNNAFSTESDIVSVALATQEDFVLSFGGFVALRPERLASGDSFIGFTESTSTQLGDPATGDVAFTFRNGQGTLVGPRFFPEVAPFAAGDRFTLSYQVATAASDDIFSHDVRFQLGEVQFPSVNQPITTFSSTGSPVEFDGDRGFTIQGALSVATISLEYVLTEDFTNSEIFFAFDGVTSSTLADGGANIAAIDNVRLEFTSAAAVPEPTTAFVLLLGGLGFVLCRSRKTICG